MVNNVRLYYVFSFAFSNVPLGEQVSIDSETCSIGNLLQKRLKEMQGEHYFFVEYHQSEEKELPTARSAIYIPFHHLSIDIQEETVETIPLGNCRKKCHMALFESGMGIITIIIEPESAPSINQLSQVASRDSFPLMRHKDGNFNESLHDIFKNEVTTLYTDINKIISGFDNKTHAKLRNLHPSIPYLISDAASTLHRFDISWIDADERLIWHDRTAETRGLDIFQEPSVALVVKVSESYRDAIDLDPALPKRKEVESAISSLLHTNAQEQMDASHALEHTSKDLRNLCSDKRFRTFFHSNCLLVLHSEERNSSPLEEFEFGLFRTYCAIRGCWHMYNIVNEQLDFSINLLFSQFEKLASPMVNEEHFLEKQREVILTKRYFLMILAMEDPLVRGIRLTEYGSLYDEAAYAFRLDEIRQLVKYKLSELDNLYNMVNSYHLRLRYISLPSSLPPGSFLRLALILVVLTGFSFWYLPKRFDLLGTIIIWLVMILLVVIYSVYQKWIRNKKGISNV